MERLEAAARPLGGGVPCAFVTGVPAAMTFDKENDYERRGVRSADRGRVRPARACGEGRGEAVTAENAVGLVLAAILTIFLIAALLYPERF
ncbi:K(+)-transporting ATPase subunit F [Actinomadura montaniterrae]|uniref:K(+)-transporting ATPase subunit F n=1 Tax=Actinomadura montaniterrae TaxID=1803903 RepID=UPI001CEF81EC|nr:K(+)-transporting ATPase subunit F [Actinomadura montaniterrae]